MAAFRIATLSKEFVKVECVKNILADFTFLLIISKLIVQCFMINQSLSSWIILKQLFCQVSLFFLWTEMWETNVLVPNLNVTQCLVV